MGAKAVGPVVIAALFVAKGGCYFGLNGVDPWDEKRDARLYKGPHPVVAHPPCSRWCRLAGLVEARWGHKRGDDGGCFASALHSVRTYGGVLEHPAFTKAFEAHGITRPSGRGWQRADCGGWVCRVDQGNYGHIAKKATWLYAYGAKDLPELVWDSVPNRHSQALVSWCGNKTDRFYDRPRVSKKAASATPLAFREVLMHIARSSRGRS